MDATLGTTQETALFASVRSGYLDLSATLLKAGANAKVKDENGDPPLIHLAKYCDEIELVRTFIRLGADVNASRPTLQSGHPMMPGTNSPEHSGQTIRVGACVA